jgi:hypothetical protein
METITLRDVAIRLGKIKQPTTKAIADTQLLSLLKSGELKAGFDFPGRTKHWISIQPDYWLKIDSSKFRSIRRNEGATFKVSIRDFADEYSQLIFAESEIQNRATASNVSLKDEFRIGLQAAARKYEVVVQAGEWEDYLKRHQLREPVLIAQKGKGGRNPKAAWRELAEIIPAYLLACQAERLQPPRYETAADEIFKIAIDKGIDANSLPQPSTLKDVISRIFEMKTDVLKKQV